MKQKDYNPTRCKSPNYKKQNIGDLHLITVPYTRDPTSPLRKLPSLEPEKMRSRSSSQSNIQGERIFKNSETIIDTPQKSIGRIKPPTSPVIITPKESQTTPRNMNEGAKLANQDFEFIRSPANPSTTKFKRGPGNPIAELESIGRKSEKYNEDDPPFNFQGMLRKTNFKRESLKRLDDNNTNAEIPYFNVLKNKVNKNMDMYENEKGTRGQFSKKGTVRFEVAPGVFLEGKEEMV